MLRNYGNLPVVMRIGFLCLLLQSVVGCQFFLPVPETATETVHGEDYVEGILLLRKQKDNDFAGTPGSPFANLEQDFQGLKYYPANMQYRVTATLLKHGGMDSVLHLADTKGEMRKYHYQGQFRFNIKGIECRLPALISDEDPKNWFILFHDPTNGKTTYHGGRYIEAEITADSTVIDFNLAYNPYCHYNPNYACPVVPKSFFINIPVEAGEKIYSFAGK